MIFIAIGKIAVASPGTPVKVSATDIPCNRIQFAVDPSDTGKTYVGSAGMNATTKAGVARIFSAPSAGPQDGMPVPPPPGGGNTHNLAHYYVDAEVAGNGPLVGYWVV